MRVSFGCVVALCAVLAASNAVAAEACPGRLTPPEAKRLQDRMFDALSRDDLAGWKALITDDFVAYENGKAYDGQGFFDLLAGAHKAGTKLVWSVTQDAAEIDCNVAVLRYVNSGSVTRRGETETPMKWLETSSFRRVGRDWRAFLVTSMRIQN